MSPELTFLLACLRGSPPRAIDPAVDPDALAALADFHGMSPWLPRWTKGAYGVSTYAAHARRNACLIAAAARVTAIFAARGIAARVLKGPVLAHYLHGDIALRQSGDVDVFVRPADAPAAVEALRSTGASMLVPLAWAAPTAAVRWNSEVPFRLREDGVEVDLHWRAAPSHSPFQLPPDALFETEQRVTVAGRHFAIPAPEPLLVFLVLHGTRHLWERLIWVSDLARLLEGPLDWRKVWQLAGQSGLESPLRVALALTKELTGAQIPGSVSLTPREAGAFDSVSSRIRAGVTPEPKTRELLRFQAALAPPAATLRHLCGLAFRPTEHDWRLVHLPEPFSALYYPLRLARLGFTYGCNLGSGRKEPLVTSNHGSITRTLDL